MNCSVGHFRVGFKRDWEVDTWVNPMLSLTSLAAVHRSELFRVFMDMFHILMSVNKKKNT